MYREMCVKLHMAVDLNTNLSSQLNILVSPACWCFSSFTSKKYRSFLDFNWFRDWKPFIDLSLHISLSLYFRQFARSVMEGNLLTVTYNVTTLSRDLHAFGIVYDRFLYYIDQSWWLHMGLRLLVKISVTKLLSLFENVIHGRNVHSAY